MSKKTDTLIELFSLFDLSAEEADLYLYLLGKPAKSVVDISRDLGIKRTKMYRMLDKLCDKSLVSQQVLDRGKRYQAEDVSRLEMIVARKEAEIKRMEKSKVELFDYLESVGKQMDKSSMVKYYRGEEGLRQVTWNSAQAKGELRIFEIDEMSAYLDYGFSEKVRKKFVENQVHVKELANSRHIPAWTEIEQFYKEYWECRYISPEDVRMRFEMLVYNDVFVMYNWKGTDLFCVEIYNEKLARVQKQMFDFMWGYGKKMSVKKGGTADVIE